MTAKDVVRAFLDEVRSGKNPRAAEKYLAREVVAHQIAAENFARLVRTPASYAEHVEAIQKEFGRFDMWIEDMLADQDKVFVRWIQYGAHVGVMEGFAPTGCALVTVTSAVYRVANRRIVEYWIQQDRHGLIEQLRRQAEKYKVP